MRKAALLTSLAMVFATFGLARADDFPNPEGCANFNTTKTGADPACDTAIAQETNAIVKSVLLYRRAYMIIDRHDYDTYPKALEDLGEALRLWPQNYRALHERAYIYNEYGRWSEALADIDARVKLTPNDYQGYRERALARFHLGDLQGNYEDRKTVVTHYRTASTLIGLADAAMWLGRFDEAAKALDDADALIVGPSEDRQQAADTRSILTALRTPSAAGAKGCTEDKNNPGFGRAGFIGDCTRAFLDAITHKGKADALTLRAIAWIQAGNEPSYRADLSIAKALDPDEASRHVNLGFAYVNAHHSAAGIQEFDRAIALKPTAIAYAGRASAKFNLNDLSGAYADAKKSFEIEPTTLGLWMLGDVVYEQTKSYDKAKEFWIGAYRLGARDDRLIQRLKDAGVPIPPPDDAPKKLAP